MLKKISIFVVIAIILFSFVDSAIYYYPAYAYEGINRDMYLSMPLFLVYTVGRGTLIAFIMNTIYFSGYFVLRKLLLIIKGNSYRQPF